MKRLIIVEGPTAAGKSSLIKGLVEATHFRVQGINVSQWTAEQAFDPAFLESVYAEAIRDGLILDRWVYSNHAYCAVFSNQARCPSHHLEMLAKSLDPVVLFLRATPGLLYSRIHGRDKPIVPRAVGSMTNLIKLVDKFRQEEQNCGLPTVGIRSHDEDLDEGRSLAKALKAIQ